MGPCFRRDDAENVGSVRDRTRTHPALRNSGEYRMTLQRKHTTPWPWANRPRDYMLDTIELRLEEYDFGGGPLPRPIWVRDPDHRSCWYRAKDMTILEPVTKRMCLRYTTLEHSWDDMPQVLVARDGWGNSCRYE